MASNIVPIAPGAIGIFELGTTVSVTANTGIPYSVILSDNNQAFVGSNSRYVIPKSGVYTVSIATQQSTGSNPSIYLAVNGSNSGYVFLSLTTTNLGLNTGTVTAPLTAGDYVEIMPDTTFSASGIANKYSIIYEGM